MTESRSHTTRVQEVIVAPNLQGTLVLESPSPLGGWGTPQHQVQEWGAKLEPHRPRTGSGSDTIRVGHPYSGFPAGWHFEVIRFCLEHRLTDHVFLALDLIAQCFPGSGPVLAEVFRSQQSEETWVVLKFEVPDDLDEALQQYEHYIIKWTEAVPWPWSDRLALDFQTG